MIGRPHPCMICGNAAEYFGMGDSIDVICGRCGRFVITGTAMGMLGDNPNFPRAARLSGWIREQNQLGEKPTIDSRTIKAWSEIPKPNVLKRANRLLEYLIEHAAGLDRVIEFEKPEAVARTYSQDVGELHVLADFLTSEGYTRRLAMRSQLIITPKGYMRHEELSAARAHSVQAFVAMWFDPSLTG